MIFQDYNDILKFMAELAENVGSRNAHYTDFAFFGRVGYTNLSEYHGELKLFIKKILEEDDIIKKDELQCLYQWLCGERT